MKYNKVIAHLFVAGLAVLALSSCKKDDDSSSTTYALTLNVTDTNKTWKSGDVIAVMQPGTRVLMPQLSYQGNDTFYGEAKSASTGINYAYIYPANIMSYAYADTVKINVNTSLQNGEVSGLQEFMLGYGQLSSVADYVASGTGSLTNMLAQGTFNLTSQGQTIQNINRIEISAASGSFHGDLPYNVRKKAWESLDNNNLILTNQSGIDGEFTLNLIPTSEVQFSFNIETTSGVRYFGRTSESYQLEADKKYEINCDLTSYDHKAKIGDYFYSDGTYSTELDRSKTVTGIVFALTDEFDGAINTSLDESYHGRVVSSKDLSSDKYRWAYATSNMVDIEQLTNYVGVNSTLETDTVAYLAKLEANNVVAINEKGQMTKWPTIGALSSFDGLQHTELCDSNQIKYQAAYLCANLSRAGFSDKRWYLPAAGELTLLYQLFNHRIICAATKSDFVDFQDFGYWSVDEANEVMGWALNFYSGMIFLNPKNSDYYVRPCMHF